MPFLLRPCVEVWAIEDGLTLGDIRTAVGYGRSQTGASIGPALGDLHRDEIVAWREDAAAALI